MSDLGGGGRAGNGGLRTGGPVPVQPSGTPQGIRTPRDIMRDRNTREQRRQEEQKAEEARRLAEERRRSAERRAATVSGVPRASQASSVYYPDVGALQGGFDEAGDRRSAAGRVSGADVLGEPTGRVQQDAPGPGKARVSSGPQPQAQPSASSGRGPRLAQTTPRQPPAQSSAGAQSTSSTAAAGGGGAQSFPHAFERWETLSSHWEGLTSYWLHKLEANTEEIRHTIPNASTLNRQINDLSAAGANLFHAVVELQRLRASSERKFQRWFFETRADTERQQEVQAQAERQLRLERSAREEAVGKRAEAEEAATLARREVAEMRRELMISKEEARRAWEELGRRNQEALDTAENLKRGMGAVVGGVNVIPYFGTASRAGSASQRPNTRDGQQQQYGGLPPTSSAGAAGRASPGDEAYYQQDPQGQTSPTNTDPFTEQQRPPLHHEPEKPSLAAGAYRSYPQGSPSQAEPPSSSRTAVPTTSAATLDQAQAFYQHGPTETFLHGSSSGAPSVPGQRREDLRSEPSYVESEGETEYAIDAAGKVRHDEQGRPVVFQSRASGPTQQRPTVRPVEAPGEEDDPYDSDAVRREREHAERYGRMPAAPEAPGGGNGVGAAGQPDYEGDGHGGWESLQSAQTRHHHPTRLSDVLEEEEERSSRHTGH